MAQNLSSNDLPIEEEAIEPHQQDDSENIQTYDPLTDWYSSLTYALDDQNCNPFASIDVHSPAALAEAVGSRSCDSDWSETDSDSNPDISRFVTDLFENPTSEQGEGFGYQGLRLSLNGLSIAGLEEGEEIWSIFQVESARQGSLPEIDENLGFPVADSPIDGLRVVGFDSESDSEDRGVDSGNNDHQGNNLVNDLEDQGSIYEDFDWEEVEERANERENVRIVIDDEVEELTASDFDTVDEEPAEVEARDLEWEFLLTVNNLASDVSLEREGGTRVDRYMAALEDRLYSIGVEFESLFDQFIESESSLKGSPPASKSVVENLPLVELTMEELQKDDVVCAVCKDGILVKEKVKRLPCCHYFHGDCIVPWLGIRNTCPVCRYELPTDDPDYEQMKSQRASRGPIRNSQVVLNFESFA
ncbi:hypothetical protein UlMin_014489 [Ulmus minor]